jgi:UDP-N-acetyl-D-mannosaminuronate dehydrogenase
MRIGFIGLGKLGLPCAEEMTRQHEVIGYDVEHRVSHT